jgi:hypothetical protein
VSTPPNVPQGLKRQPIPFGKYLLLDRVNVGGMAEVWRGKQFAGDGTDRIVAIKRILPNIAEDEEFITMFIDEAKISVQLTHENICQLFDLGNTSGSYFIAMEYIPGKDLRAIFDRAKKANEPPPVPMVAYAVSRMSAGLDHAHRKKDLQGNDLNIVHRDISPQNCLVSFEGMIKVIDFGIAKAANKASRTQAGILKGKFGYMAPEQILGGDIDRRADIFAIGVVLWEMLTNQRLFVGDSDFAVLEKVRKADVPAPSKHNPRVPAELDRITLKALSRDIHTRYQFASDLADDLDAFLQRTGSLFGPKEMAGYMRTLFAEEVERERLRLVDYASVKAPDPTGRAPVGRAPTGAMPAIRPAAPARPTGNGPAVRPGQSGTAGGVKAPAAASSTPAPARATAGAQHTPLPGKAPAAGTGNTPAPVRAPAALKQAVGSRTTQPGAVVAPRTATPPVAPPPPVEPTPVPAPQAPSPGVAAPASGAPARPKLSAAQLAHIANDGATMMLPSDDEEDEIELPSGPAVTGMDDDELLGVQDLAPPPPVPAPKPAPTPAKARAPLPAAVPSNSRPAEKPAPPPVPEQDPFADLGDLPSMEELPGLDAPPTSQDLPALDALPAMEELPGLEASSTGEVHLPPSILFGDAAVESTAIRPTPLPPPVDDAPRDDREGAEPAAAPSKRRLTGDQPPAAAAPAGGGKAGWIVAVLSLLVLAGVGVGAWQLGILERLNTGRLALDLPLELAPNTLVTVDGEPTPWPKHKSGKFKRPFTVKLPKGVHAVEVRVEGFKPWTASVDVVADEISEEEVALERLPVRLSVTLSPETAEVKLDGKTVREAGGAGPVELQLLESGTLEVSAAGHIPQSVTVTREDAEKGVAVKLKPSAISFKVASEPAGAAVFVDGKDAGVLTPAVLTLTLGQAVELQLHCHDAAPVALRAPVAPGEAVELNAALVRQPNCK